MRVQAFDTLTAAPPTPPEGTGPVWSIGRSRSRSLGIEGVGVGELGAVHGPLGSAYATGGLQPARPPRVGEDRTAISVA